MKFLNQIWEVLTWIGRVLRRLMQVRPGTTLTIIASRILRKLSAMLAMLLPLKVMILAGSPGVPHYFQPFLSEEYKTIGIFVLAGAAIGFYFLTLALDALGKRMADKGGDALMAESAGMSIVSNQREEMTSHYTRVTSIAGALLFTGVSFALLLRFDHYLALHLVVFTVISLGVTALALRQREDHSRSRLATFILDETGSYLGVLSSLAFLTGFLVIVYPLVMGHHGTNVLGGILIVTLFRTVIGTATGMVKDIKAMAGQRLMVDTLIFPEHRMREPAELIDASLQELFAKQRREERFRADLPELAPAESGLNITWQDPVLRDAHKMTVTVTPADEAPAHCYEQHVYQTRINRPLQNENLLFRHVSREDVFAPPVAGRYTYGPFECVVYEGGTGRAPTMAEWPKIKETFFMRLCALQPPKALTDAYKSTHFLLSERMHDDLVDRTRIAIENDEDAARLQRIRDCLPRIRSALAPIPLCISNPDFKPPNLTLLPDGGFQVMSWGQWLLEPFGVRFDMAWSDEVMERYIAHARKHRADFSSSITARHIRLLDECSKLERRMKGGSFRNALNGSDELAARLEALDSVEPLKLSA